MTIEQTKIKNETSKEEMLVEGLRLKPQDKNRPEHIEQAKKEILARARRLIDAPNDDILLSTDGYLRWRGEVIADLTKGETQLKPNILVLADISLEKEILAKIKDRLNLWLSHHINTVFEQIIALDTPEHIEEKDALELTQRLYANFGILPRHKILNLVKGLDQDTRAKLRALGIKFGAFHIYLPLSIKPAQRELALILFALQNGDIRQYGVSSLPLIILSGRTSFEIDKETAPKLYEVAGFKIVGNRAVRIDILERLADLIRPLIAFNPDIGEDEIPEGAAKGNGFRVNVEMTSLLGCAGEDFSAILKSLGYRVERLKIEAEETKEVKEEKKDDKSEETSEEIKYDEVWYKASFSPAYKNASKKQKPFKNKQTNFKNKGKFVPKNKPKEKAIDPDSPFAALLALKNKT